MKTYKDFYDLWMRAAKTLHAGVAAFLFGACYILVVPIFFLMIWPFDVLRLRRSDAPTFWIRRRTASCDLRSLQRMG